MGHIPGPATHDVVAVATLRYVTDPSSVAEP